MIAPGLRRVELEDIAAWEEGPEALRNMLSVLAAEAARRHRWADVSNEVMAACTNPLYEELWRRWQDRIKSRASEDVSQD